MKLRSTSAIAILACGSLLVAMAQTNPGEPVSIPKFEMAPRDPVALSLGSQGDFPTGIYKCSGDHSVFVTMITTSTSRQIATGFSLYAVRGPTDVVAYRSSVATGFRTMGPVYRYFAGESKVVALAWGLPLDSGDTGAPPDPKQSVPVLLTFDHKGALLSSKVLDRSLHPEQIGLFPSGEILLLRWDRGRKLTVLEVLNDQGSEEREIPMTANDPADSSAPGGTALVTVEIYAWGNHLLLVPDSSSQAILEVSESGVVNTWTLHIPKGYERGVPVAFDSHRWMFRMDPEGKQGDTEAEMPFAERARIGEAKPTVVMEFDPSTGNPVRQFAFPAGLQPACEVDGEFLFLGANPDDGKLQFATALMPN